jgi:glycerol-3-phosphate acyltransferase PlsX
MKIAIDAMGGDFAPQATVAGAVRAARETSAEIILVGVEAMLRAELSKVEGGVPENVSVRHASQVIECTEPPTLALRSKKDSSIVVACRLVRDGEADAVVTAGSTGAAVVASKVILRTLPGVNRPAIATFLPNPKGVTVLLDAGANADCRPGHLYQFAVMGSIFSHHVLGVPNPSIGLLNIGAESSKGNELTRAAHALLEKHNNTLNFLGNSEGNDLYTGRVDVVVCDGFVGNVILKVCEGLAGSVTNLLRQELTRGLASKLGGFLMKQGLLRFRNKIDYEEYGGAPLLGVQGTVTICHGRSSSRAIANAVNEAERAVARGINDHIVEALANGVCGEPDQ